MIQNQDHVLIVMFIWNVLSQYVTQQPHNSIEAQYFCYPAHFVKYHYIAF